jgi:UDP-glucose 4-epimerase
VLAQASAPFNVYNLGSDETCTVDDSLDWICARLGVAPARRYGGGARGWIGDSPFIFLDTAKVRALGWRPALGIRAGVERTLDWLIANPWVLERRA